MTWCAQNIMIYYYGQFTVKEGDTIQYKQSLVTVVSDIVKGKIRLDGYEGMEIMAKKNSNNVNQKIRCNTLFCL